MVNIIYSRMKSSLMLQLDVVCTNIFNAMILQEFSVMQVSVSLLLLRPAVRASSRPFSASGLYMYIQKVFFRRFTEHFLTPRITRSHYGIRGPYISILI